MQEQLKPQATKTTRIVRELKSEAFCILGSRRE